MSPEHFRIEPEPAVKTREQILLDAADAIEKFGYQSGSIGVPISFPHVDGRLCILGAVAVAMEGPGASSYGYWKKYAHVLGVSEAVAYYWSDNLDSRMVPNKSKAKRVAHVLRSLAKGRSWTEAVASTWS